MLASAGTMVCPDGTLVLESSGPLRSLGVLVCMVRLLLPYVVPPRGTPCGTTGNAPYMVPRVVPRAVPRAVSRGSVLMRVLHRVLHRRAYFPKDPGHHQNVEK